VLPVESPDRKAAVLRWTGLEIGTEEVTSFFDLAPAKSVQEADQILARIGVPSWNFVFADVQGNIGYRAIGRVPRFEQDPPFGVPVEDLDRVENSPAFSRPLLAEEMPHVINPARDFIATANQRQWPSDSKLSSGRAQLPSYRGFRIEELIQHRNHLALADHQRIQCDVQAVDARFITPKLIEVLESREIRRLWQETDLKVVRALRSWNYEADLRCKVCGLYRRWVENIYKQQKLNSTALFRKLSGKVDLDFKKVVFNAFHLALDDIGYTATHELKPWGEIHKNSFHHLAGNLYFPVAPIATPGDEHSVNPGSLEWNGQLFDHTNGASQRIIVEMTKPPRVYSNLPGSNQDLESVEPSVPHSDWEEWAKCEFKQKVFPVDWNQAVVRKKATLFPL
jgi:penicillin amidase